MYIFFNFSIDSSKKSDTFLNTFYEIHSFGKKQSEKCIKLIISLKNIPTNMAFCYNAIIASPIEFFQLIIN